MVAEVYHAGYVAKHLEVRRRGRRRSGGKRGPGASRRPATWSILLGGRTGRDGIGGATGSSKSHNQSVPCHHGQRGTEGQRPGGAEDPAPVPATAEVTRIIKRCNDFGAGGVSVAIGELADGLHIDLDAGTQEVRRAWTAQNWPSPSRQERMAVVVAPEDAERFIAAAQCGKPGGVPGGGGHGESPGW